MTLTLVMAGEFGLVGRGDKFKEKQELCQSLPNTNESRSQANCDTQGLFSKWLVQASRNLGNAIVSRLQTRDHAFHPEKSSGAATVQ
jgi:hypothetical protein